MRTIRVKCPKCRSKRISIDDRKEDGIERPPGVVVVGGIGLSGHTEIPMHCHVCGHRWFPAEDGGTETGDVLSNKVLTKDEWRDRFYELYESGQKDAAYDFIRSYHEPTLEGRGIDELYNFFKREDRTGLVLRYAAAGILCLFVVWLVFRLFWE